MAVISSRWYENQPLAVLEAFACGLPVVGTAPGGIPELVSPGVDGEIVPPNDPAALADALVRLLAHPRDAYEMGRAGREKVAKSFSSAAHLGRLEGLYAEARDRAGGRPSA